MARMTKARAYQLFKGSGFAGLLPHCVQGVPGDTRIIRDYYVYFRHEMFPQAGIILDHEFKLWFLPRGIVKENGKPTESPGNRKLMLFFDAHGEASLAQWLDELSDSEIEAQQREVRNRFERAQARELEDLPRELAAPPEWATARLAVGVPR